MIESKIGIEVSALSVNIRRLKADLDAVNALGTVPGTPGINRLSFSDADMAGRRWLIEAMAGIGLDTWMDGVGNVFGRWEVGSGAPLMIGSHLDTVTMGGPLDGTLGVCAGLEAIRCIQESHLEPIRPIVLVATADEEGRFGGMLGSQAICGEVDAEWINRAIDDNGHRLEDALAMQGLGLRGDPHWDPECIAAFLELHIEQGPVLDRAGLDIGIVDAVSGVFNWTVTLTGEANHSGTTPMDHRRDAFRGMADFGSMIDTILAEAGGNQSRITVGKVSLAPNFPHSIAGTATFSIIGRDTEPKVMVDLAASCQVHLEKAAEQHGLALDIAKQSCLPPTQMSPEIRERLSALARRAGLPARVMPSGAGHDAQTFARHVPSGLVFVPSVGGISHAPNEHTDLEHIRPGATLFVQATADLACAPSCDCPSSG